jgi:hypothetical protein
LNISLLLAEQVEEQAVLVVLVAVEQVDIELELLL